MTSSAAALYYKYSGSQFDPVKSIQDLQAQHRRDEALDLVQFYEENQTIDSETLKELKSELEYTMFEKFKSVGSGALTGAVYDFYSGIGAIASDLFIFGDIRDIVIQSWKFIINEEVDVIVAVLSGLGIALSIAPYTDVIASYLKNTIKYLRRISIIVGKSSILKPLLKGKLTFAESKKVLNLFRKNNWSIPRTAGLLSNIHSIKHLELATELVAKFGNTGRVLINLTGNAGLVVYSIVPKSLRAIYLKGFKINPIVLLGLTRTHFIIHSLKVLKKYKLAGIVAPLLGLSLAISMLPSYLISLILVLSIAYLTVIIWNKYQMSGFKLRNAV